MSIIEGIMRPDVRIEQRQEWLVEHPYADLLRNAKQQLLSRLASEREQKNGDWHLRESQEHLIGESNVLNALLALVEAARAMPGHNGEVGILYEHPLLKQADGFRYGSKEEQELIADRINAICEKPFENWDLYLAKGS